MPKVHPVIFFVFILQLHWHHMHIVDKKPNIVMMRIIFALIGGPTSAVTLGDFPISRDSFPTLAMATHSHSTFYLRMQSALRSARSANSFTKRAFSTTQRRCQAVPQEKPLLLKE